MNDDLISRQAAIDIAMEELDGGTPYDIPGKIDGMPSAEPERKTGAFTIDEVAMILSNVFGDECACNFNGIDEWLPQSCKYAEIADECPHPSEKNGCWKQFLIQGGADMRGKEDV